MLTALIAEDDVHLAELWRVAFTRAGFDVHIVYNGNEAIDYLKTSSLPNLLIVDQMMPGPYGAEVLQVLDELDPQRHVIRAMITASRDACPPDIEQRVSVFLEKPIQFAKVVALAKELISAVG